MRLNIDCALDDVLAAMRQVGLTKGRSVILLAHLTSMPHSAAKRLVQDSAAWADRRAGDEEFHAHALREFGSVNKP
jgi:hypothetical protein